jgi:TP901 family phage tail tape measure protein
LAETRAVINVDINTGDATAALRSLQSQLNAFNSTLTKSSAVQSTAIRNAKDNLTELVNASRFFSAETVRMQTAASALDKTLSKGQVTLGQFFGAKFRKDSLAAAQVLSLAETRAAALQTQFVATGAAANGMREAIAIRPLQAFNSAAVVSAQKLAIHRAMLQQATTSMINFGKNTQWAGRQLMVGFTVPLTIFAAAAGKSFRELEKEAVNFKKVYGDAFTPPEEMEENLNAVKELAKEYTKYGIAVKDTVALAAQAAAAGAQNKDLLDATTQATRLATLGQMEQNQALETTISLQNAFKLSGDDLAKSINFLNMVENQTVVTLQDLSAAIPRVAPVIKGLGGDVEDLAAFLAAMQEGGVTAEQGANALKSGLASLINPTEKAKEALQGMGISLDSIIQMNRGDLMGTIQGFADALDTLDTFSRQQALEKVFGKFQYARLGALFDNINKNGTQAARVLEMTGMSAAEMAASAEKELGAIEESVGVKFTAAMEKLKLAIAPIGEMFTKMAIPIVNFFVDILDKFNNLPDFAKKFIGLGTVITGIVIPAGTMFLGLLMNLVGTLVKFGSMIGIAFKGFLSGGIKGAFDAVSQATRYMALSEIDASLAAQQLAGTTEAVNIALLEQVGASESAQAAVMELALAYEILGQQMREAGIQNELVFGTGAAAMGVAGKKGPRVRRNRGGTIPGSGNTDKVPAMLTPGEFVINKKATQENLPLLKQINDGGKVPGFILGGAVIGSRLLAAATSVKSRPLTMPMGAMPVSLPTTTMAKRFQAAHLGSAYPTTSQITALRSQKVKKSARLDFAETLSKSGLPVIGLTDDWVVVSSALNQAAKRRTTKPMTIRRAIEDLYENKDSLRIGPAMSRAGVSQDKFVDELAESLLNRNRNRLDDFITDIELEAARDAVYSGLGIQKNLKGVRIPGEIELFEWVAARKNIPIENVTESLLKSELKGVGFKLTSAQAGGKRSLVHIATGQSERLGDSTSFRSAAAVPLNKGGMIVPGQGNSDTIPAMLTPGEFVVNKKATQSNMALLKAINDGRIKGYELGGLVESTPGQYLVEGRNGRIFGPMPYNQAINRSKQLVSARARRSIAQAKPRGTMMRGAMGGASMLGMTAMMGGMMIPGVAESPVASTAMMGVGTALSMAPMLAGMGPAGLAIAGVAAAATAAGVALYKWRDSVDTAARQAADFGANLGGTANALNNVASMLGQQTPAQRQAQLQLGISEQDIKKLSESTEFQNIFTSEEGQKFITDLENATSADRFKKLSDYLTYAIAAGFMDASMAQSFAKGISAQIGDAILGSQVASAISKTETGPQALIDLGEKRIQEASNVIANVIENNKVSYQDSSKAIGAATQIIQDFSNAEELAREQYATGAITYEELQSVVQKSRDIQNDYTNAIEQAMKKTSDFGGTMQAVKDQIIAAGLATPEELKAMEAAAQPKGIVRGGEVSGSQVSDVIAGRITESSVGFINSRELQAAQQQALFSGMAPANIISISEQISTGKGPMFDLYQQAIARGQGGGTAFETAAAAQEIANMVPLIKSALPIAMQKERVQNAVLDFSISGGDPTALASIIASLPEDGIARYEFITDFRGFDPEQQTKYISDFQKLSSLLGSEFANQFQASSEYQNAIKAGTEDALVATVEKASSVFGDNTQKIIDYSKQTGISLTELTQYGSDLASMSSDLQFRLDIDLSDPEIVNKFGPIAKTLKENWPILQNLNKNVDLKLYTEFLTKDGEGNDLPPGEVANRTQQLNKLWKQFEAGKTVEARKAAYLQLYTLQNGAPVSQAKYDEMWNDLVSEFGQQRIANLPADQLNKVFQINAEIQGAETAIEALRGMAAAAYAMENIAKGDEYIQRMQDLQSSIKGLEAQRVSTVRFSKPIDRGNGGGGGQKSIAEQLAEKAKESQAMLSGITKLRDTRGFKSFISGPFAPEFLEYLRSQGAEGLKLIKGGLDKVRAVYADYIKDKSAQLASQAMIAPGLRREELNSMRQEISLRNKLKSQGRSQEEIDFIVERTSEYKKLIAANKDFIAQEMKKPKGQRDKESISILKEHNSVMQKDISLVEQDAVAYMKLAKAQKYAQMSTEDLTKTLRDLQMEENDILRQLDEIRIIKPLQDQLEAQQKINDGISRSIELKQREADTIGRNIELKQRELEPIDDQITAYEDQIDKINEAYDSQLEALDKIYQKEESLARLREGKANVATALARGDIGAAAQAAMELQRTMAAQRQEDARSAIEQAKQNEIQAVETNINALKDQRKVIETEIANLQEQQRIKQDEIYNLELSRIPVQDEIYRLENLITTEADKLDDQYTNAANEAANLRDRLIEVKNEAYAVAAALSAQANAQNSLNAANAAANWTPAGGGQIYGSEAQNRMFGGNINKYAIGGMVSYKGSREPAPGFMMGGKIKKFATGSFVPGTGMTDKVPAMLTPGEFVVRKSVAQQYAPLLENLNGQIYPKLGAFGASKLNFSSPSFSGGPGFTASDIKFNVPPTVNSFMYPQSTTIGNETDITSNTTNYVSGPTTVQYNYNLSVSAGTNASPDDIANTILYKIKRIEDRNIKGTQIG